MWLVRNAAMGLGQFIYDYQTLIAGTAAIGAAYIAAHPVWRQLKLNQTQANGVLREMLIDRESELRKAKTAVSEKIGRPLNDLDLDIGFDGPPQKLTEHEAHHHDLGISHAVSWLRLDYPWRDSAKAEAAREQLVEKLDSLLNILSEIHGPAHVDQVGEDYAMSNEEWAAFVARGEAAKDEIPDQLRESQGAYRDFLSNLDAEKSAIQARLRSVNEALTLI
jgi:hypothetical protein